MDEQYGGRTDDDLFYDDFEPVNSETIIVEETREPRYHLGPSAAPPPATAEHHSQPRQPDSNRKSSTPAGKAPRPQPQAQPQPQGGGNLSSSRFARKAKGISPKQQPTPPPAARKSPTPTAATGGHSRDKQPGTGRDEVDATPPPNAPTAPAKDSAGSKSHHASSQSAPAVQPEARLGSGANPRQKLTEAELAAKMEQMKLLSAEKARKFEMAEQDEKQHAQAYAKGMEEARRRKAEDAERRRRGEEDKRRLDEERAKNRERKLKAMGMKEGGWDEGKEAAPEEEARRGFRGADGGVKGAKRHGGGLAGSRFAARDAAADRQGQERADVDRFLDERQRHGGGRGRGARGAGRGRGGASRGAFDGSSSSSSKPGGSAGRAPALTTDEFPALPSDGTRKKKEGDDAAPPPVYPPPGAEDQPIIPSLAAAGPPGGKWDDEMEALDELKKQSES